MRNEADYIHIINFINLFHTLRDQENWKSKAESKKMWCVARFGTICTILKLGKTPIEQC